MTFADSELEYRDLDGTWGDFRLFVGGKDVTNFRGKRAQIGSYQLTEPFSYGPADFFLPALTQFEVDAWGAGALRWMGNGKPVVLKQVVDGGVVDIVWRGFITITEVTTTGVTIHCDGEASGRLSLMTKLPDLFQVKHRVGRKLWQAFGDARLHLTPYLGADIGVLTDGRGMSGSYLDYVNALLAATIGTDGSQYTIWQRPTGDYHLGLKDTDSVNFTAFVGAHGVEIDLSQDLSEQPTTIYGQGVAPNGLIWVNGKYPDLVQGATPRYPMDDDSAFGQGTVDADTSSGAGVTTMIFRLVGTGYLDHRDQPGGFDSDVTDAISDFQDFAGLTATGNMNPATWRALYDLDVTGLDVSSAHIAPLAQASKVRKWFYSSSGRPLRRNPDYDPKAIDVHLAVDHGVSVEKSRARRWSKGTLHRSQQEKNWAGTVTLTSDVFHGSYAHSDGSPTLLSRLDIRPGMNMMLKHFDGNTLFHVSIVNVNADLSVTLGVDTQARDAATLGEVIARNIESRSHPARQWLQARRTDAHSRFVEFSEVGGQVFDEVRCPGGEWTIVPIVAGVAGSVSRVRIQTRDDEAKFVVAAFGKKVSPGWLRQHVGNPFDSNRFGESKWTDAGVQSVLDDERVLLGAWGDDAQPAGYHPRSHTKADGTVSDAPITGLLLDDGGFDYHTFGDPVLYVAIYPDRDTKIPPQRVLWETLEVNT